MSPGWEEIPHTADWALRVRGEDLRSLFENAARGMVSLIGGEAEADAEANHRDITLHAPDLEVLLVDWLTELLVLIEEEGVVLTDIGVSAVDDLALAAHVATRRGGQFSKQIKAVTYHNLAVRRSGEGFETTIVFDV
jgi:SHS2 domain-containing protein